MTATIDSSSSGGSSSAKIVSSSKTKTVSDPNDATDTAATVVANDSSAGLLTKAGLRMHASTAVALLILSDEGKPYSLQANDNAVNVETTLKLQNSMAGNPNGIKKSHAESINSTVMDLLFSNKPGIVTDNRSSDTNKVSNVT